MTVLLKQIFVFIKLLNSDKGGRSIAAGIALGFVLGLSPLLSLQGILVILTLFFFRVQIGAALMAAFFFAFLGFLLDPAFDRVGSIVLEAEALQALFVSMYNAPIIPFTRFNNSVVMGAGVVTLAALPLVYGGALFLVNRYRETVVARFEQTKWFKAFKASPMYNWYIKYDQLFG